MRNGLSLHPMCLPGVLQPLQFSQTRMNFGEENGSLPMNMSDTVPANPETSVQMVFDLPNQCSSSNPASVPNMSNIITSETSFGLESIQAQFGPFQLLSSSQVSHMHDKAWKFRGIILAGHLMLRDCEGYLQGRYSASSTTEDKHTRYAQKLAFFNLVEMVWLLPGLSVCQNLV